MTETPRQNDAKILVFMGEVRTEIKHSNEIQRDYIIDRKDIYEKIEGLGTRMTKAETKQGLIVIIGSMVSLTVLGTVARGIWSHFSKTPPHIPH